MTQYTFVLALSYLDFHDSVAFYVASGHQNRFQRSQSKVVVGLIGQLFVAEFEERNDFAGELFCRTETLTEEHNFGDQLAIGCGHGQRSEQFLQIVGQV